MGAMLFGQCAQAQSGPAERTGWHGDSRNANFSNQRNSSWFASTPSRQVRLQGQVNQVHSVTLWDRSGQDLKHTVARLYLEDGRRLWVDFGENVNNRHAELRNGDYIVVRGERGRIDGRPVLMADRYRVMGRDTLVTRSEDRESRADADQKVRLFGRVANAEMISLYEPDGPNTCLRVNLQNGSALLIDLGVPTYRARLDIDQGDNLSVSGHRYYVKGQPVIRAEHLWINDQEVRLHQRGEDRGDGLLTKMP